MNGQAVELIDIDRDIKEKHILKKVSLNIGQGEFMTILGPSGAGKTTILRLVAGFDNPTNGTILINDNDITKVPSNKRNIEMLFQNYALFPHMTVAENVAYPLKIRKCPKADREKRVEEALSMVRLDKLGGRYPRELSGGQQQRVALARALVFNPSVLLLDEPMAALDKQLRKYMQLEIKSLQEKLGITTISVTHDQEEALTMATKVCVLKNGQVEQVSGPREIYDKPKNTFIAKFIGETNIYETEIIGREGDKYRTSLFGQIPLEVEDKELDLPVGGKMFLSIRPEKLRLVGADYPGLKISGKIVQSIFVGESLKIKIKIQDDIMIDAKILTTAGVMVQNGDTIHLTVDVDDIVALRE